MIRRVAMGLLVGVLVAGMTAWAAGVVYYTGPGGPGVRGALTAVLVAAVGLAFAVVPGRRRTLGGFLVVFAVVLGWWLTRAASNDRDWQPEVAVTPSATIAGDLVTIRGVRNFDYRTEQDFVPRWETRTYDLRRLESGDLIAVYWGSPAIAHIMLSFGFGQDHVAISIETRKELGESYSTLAGFFRQYELVYVVADERDVLRVRTTYRQPQEDVYVYPVRVPIENVRRVFLDYVTSINDLHARPRFYNTLTTNCTTGVLLHTRVNPGSPPLSWKVLLSGYVPEYVHALGRLDTAQPFPELRRRSWINARAHAADRDPAFSQRIREGAPAATRP